MLLVKILFTHKALTIDVFTKMLDVKFKGKVKERKWLHHLSY